MRTTLLIVLLAFSASTLAARDLKQTQTQSFDLLSELEPVYDFLNYTGLSDYPLKDCWLFPQPAISVLYEGAPYQVAFLATKADKTAGAAVANAWCQEKGFEGAVDYRQSDFSDPKFALNSIYIGDGTLSAPGTGSAFKYIECANKPAIAGCSRDAAMNQGWNNTGTGNVGNSNTGSSNVGDFNSGSANVGLFIDGSASKGIGFKCSACGGATLLSSP